MFELLHTCSQLLFAQPKTFCITTAGLVAQEHNFPKYLHKLSPLHTSAVLSGTVACKSSWKSSDIYSHLAPLCPSNSGFDYSHNFIPCKAKYNPAQNPLSLWWQEVHKLCTQNDITGMFNQKTMTVTLDSQEFVQFCKKKISNFQSWEVMAHRMQMRLGDKRTVRKGSTVSVERNHTDDGTLVSFFSFFPEKNLSKSQLRWFCIPNTHTIWFAKKGFSMSHYIVCQRK